MLLDQLLIRAVFTHLRSGEFHVIIAGLLRSIARRERVARLFTSCNSHTLRIILCLKVGGLLIHKKRQTLSVASVVARDLAVAARLLVLPSLLVVSFSRLGS